MIQSVFSGSMGVYTVCRVFLLAGSRPWICASHEKCGCLGMLRGISDPWASLRKRLGLLMHGLLKYIHTY